MSGGFYINKSLAVKLNIIPEITELPKTRQDVLSLPLNLTDIIKNSTALCIIQDYAICIEKQKRKRSKQVMCPARKHHHSKLKRGKAVNWDIGLQTK